MTPRQIIAFFRYFDTRLNLPTEIILVGASAGALMGHIRPSVDIDFEIRVKNAKSPATRERLRKAIEEAVKIHGVAVNYSENIGGWSMISYLNYRKTAVPYKKIGKLHLKLIAPEYWTIGKMARFLELDIQDMRKIIKHKNLKAIPLIRVWAAAVKASDLSLELGQFREHTVYFLTKYAKKLWGKAADPRKLIHRFHQLSGYDSQSKN